MDVDTKADLIPLIDALEIELIADQGDGPGRSWNHLIDRCEEIEVHAHDLGVTESPPKPIWRPREIYNFDYQTPFARITNEIHRRLNDLRDAIVGKTPPRWDKASSRLMFGTKVARTVNTNARRVRQVLDAFEAAAWRGRIETPFPGEPDKHHSAIDSFNTGSTLIKLRSDGTGTGIEWFRELPELPEVLP
jgi:hypothetical protein